MELHNLSSNWKALRQTLHKETSQTKPQDQQQQHQHQHQHNGALKRKASSNGQHSSHSKRRKPSSSSPASSVQASEAREPTTTAAAAADLPILSPTSALDRALENTGLHGAHAARLGKYVGLDCEMVGTGRAPPHDASRLARVSLVSYTGHQVYDSFVLPAPGARVTDYRTRWSGVTPALLARGRDFDAVRAVVAALLRGRVLVGHALANDLAALRLGHEGRR
ncbi:MAG: hypothetical protein LQ340_007490, partial [Diploschistes diacapsis]